MSIAIICQNKDPQPWKTAISRLAGDIKVQIWPNIQDPDEVIFALVWNHPAGSLSQLSNLQTVASMGAGVEQVVSDSQIPEDCQLTRIVDPNLVVGMTDYLKTILSAYRHHLVHYRNAQNSSLWLPKPPLQTADLSIGVLGLGQLGGAVAKELASLGFCVSGWSRSNKNIKRVQCFSGTEQFPDFLGTTQILINLLPLTSETRGILNRKSLSLLKPGAYLINVGRGAHLDEQSLIELIESGHLSGACLDVFDNEPLDAQSLLWQQDRILITPHVSSLTDPYSAAEQVVENYRRTLKNQPLINQVCKQRGY